MDGYFSRRRGSFKAYLTIQANPSATITATGDRATYSGVADNGTGLLTLEIKKKGVYTLTTSNNANSNAEGNSTTINVDKTGGRYTVQIVKINVPDSLTVANYSSNALTAYWAKPTTNWSGVNLRRKTGSAPTDRNAGDSVYSGVGNMGIVVNASTNVNGYTNTGLAASTTYYYSIFSYLNINNITYWSTTYRTGAATAQNYVGLITTITSTRNWSAPAGWRSIQIFGVGGGGGGAGGKTNAMGGGGGGRTATSGAINIIPGKTYAVEVGLGGAGGLYNNTAADDPSHGGKTGGATKFSVDGTNVFYVGGGDGGWYYRTSAEGYSGGWGGSGGGAQGYYSEGSSLNTGGARGGSNGENGGNVQGSRDGHMWWGGKGQGSTTRAWGSSSGTLYAGGGGGGGRGGYSGGSGGAGGGANGGTSSAGYNGTANTGGGGGGGGGLFNGGSGGSGIMLIKCIA